MKSTSLLVKIVPNPFKLRMMVESLTTMIYCSMVTAKSPTVDPPMPSLVGQTLCLELLQVSATSAVKTMAISPG